ncbi:MAG: hypothetical protein AAB511_04435 [Patescibacteria group bacterium]
MNKTTTIVGWVLALLVIAGFIFYAGQNAPSLPDSLTPPASENNPTNTTPPVVNAPQPGHPSATTGAQVAPSDTSAVVTGTVTPNGAFTTYWYEYSLFSDLSNRTSSMSHVVGSGYISIPAPGYITGLAKNTTYYFRLVAENQYGRVFGGQYSFRTTDNNPPPVGSAPNIKTLAANDITRTTANLNGEVTPNRASTQYWFEYGKGPNLGSTSAFVAVGDGIAKLPASISLSDLDPATTYYFRLNAQNQFGTVNGAILNFKTSNPPAATAPTVTTRSANDIGTSTATLRGTVNPNRAETRYWFEYSTDSLLGSLLLVSTEQRSIGAGGSAVSVQTDISGLSSRTNYYFRVVAQNDLGVVRGERVTFRTR